MPGEIVSLGFEADLAKYRAEVAKIPGITKSESGKMVKEWVAAWKANDKAARDGAEEMKRAQKEAADAAKKHAGEAERAWKDQQTNISKVADKFTGGMAGDFEDLAGAVGSSGAAAALSVAAFAVLAAGVVAGAGKIHEFIGSADQLVDRLEQIEGARGIPQDSIDALDEYRQTSLGAEAASARLQVRVAGLAAAAFEPAMATLTGFLGRLDAVVPSAQAVTEEIDAIQRVARVAMGILTLGVSEVGRYALGLDQLDDEGRAAAEGLRDVAAAAEEANTALAAGEAFLDMQREAVVVMTGATSAQIAMFKAVEQVDEITRKQLDTLDLSSERYRENADAIFESGEIRKKQIVAEYEEGEAKKQTTEALRRKAEAERRAADEARKATEAEADRQEVQHTALAAERDLVDARVAASQATNTMRQKYAAAFASEAAEIDARVAAEIAAIDATSASYAEKQAWITAARDQGAIDRAALADKEAAAEAEAAKKAADAKKAAQKEITDAALQAAAVTFDIIDKLAEHQIEANKEAIDRERSKRKKVVAEYRKQRDAFEAGADDMSATEREAARASLDVAKAGVEAARAGAHEKIEAEQKAARRAFRGQQTAAVGQIGMATAVAITQALAQLGPIAGGIAATAIGASGVVQAGLVMAEKPPKFHTGRVPGGAPDEVAATLKRDEGVANGQAMSTPGFRDVLDAANAGTLGAGSGDTILALNDRAITRIRNRMDKLRRGGRAEVKVRKSGTGTAYGR